MTAIPTMHMCQTDRASSFELQLRRQTSSFITWKSVREVRIYPFRCIHLLFPCTRIKLQLISLPLRENNNKQSIHIALLQFISFVGAFFRLFFSRSINVPLRNS